ncbi:ABC transporter substrate-binding protein [Actinophytocola algeriensis]|uniref:Iron complex transport system substrate-binding protein n=1 Tax=Actinophytocola algeriensis TaxID=1768010 RepID=A0A7W7QB70_9PSEU|nr:ABC transporter substrate-binding protein [Actinophytocola algeriensis]MBB4910248.1 iron complex transport system substrate-binding protein [Actinophytocola algeriensis]MBE1480763.1 iron complex transport system substrate-binding protein [Actinophytocola algeriensis]
MSSTARRFAALTVAGALLVAGCANRDQPSDQQPGDSFDATSAAFPVTVDQPGGEPVTIEKRPARIVSLSASNTETLYAVGAGEQVVAVDDQSDHPADAPETDLSGLTPNVEAISNHNPDLVVISDDADNLVESLKAINVPVLAVPAAKTLDDVYAGMTAIGKATGHADEAADLVERTKDGLDKVIADTPKPATALTYYHELDTTLYSATSKTFIGQVYGLFGLTNIADPADVDAGGYPQLSNEAILQADPDLIFLADVQCCGQNAGTVAARPGWGTLTAVRNGNVVELDDDLASRWGPRVVDLAKSVAAAVTKAGEQN